MTPEEIAELLELSGGAFAGTLRALSPEVASWHPAEGEWVHHDGNHLRQALANVQAYVWPKMGNARCFSSG